MITSINFSENDSAQRPSPSSFTDTPEDNCPVNFRYWGQVILDRALKLNAAVRQELLAPISRWIEDPDWMKKFKKNADVKYDWLSYKKKQRQREKTQRYLSSERLKRYRQEIRRKKSLRTEVRALFSEKKPEQIIKDSTNYSASNNSFAVKEIYGVFSPDHLEYRECHAQFDRARKLSLSMLLPWDAIIYTEIINEKESEQVQFSELSQYCIKLHRQEKICKFMALLDMANQSEIEISQQHPLSDISIHAVTRQRNIPFLIKEPNANECRVDWRFLSGRQRQQVVNDVLENKIILSRDNGA